MLGLIAASVAPFHKSRSFALFLAFIAILATTVAFGFQPIRWVVVHLPVIKAMKNARLILVADFGIAAMAGLGISWLEQPIKDDDRKRGLIYVGVTGLAIGFCIYELHRATWVPVEFMRSPWGSLLFLLIAVALFAARLGGYLRDRVFQAGVFGLCALEMLTFSYGYLGFTPAREVFPSAPVLDFLATRSDLKEYRIAKDHYPIPHDAGMIYGFEAADGYDITTERTRTFTADLAEDRPDGVMFLADKILQTNDRRFDLLNVKYLLITTPSPEFDSVRRSDRFSLIYSKGSVAVFENKLVLPRVVIVPASGIEAIPTQAAQLDRLRQSSFDPLRSVVFSDYPGGIPAGAGQGASATIELLERTVNSYRFRVHSDKAAVAVISQMYYPGWKAFVNGSAASVYPADYALMGVPIPAGTSEVQVLFRPESFMLGAGISLLSLVMIVGLAVFDQRSSFKRE